VWQWDSDSIGADSDRDSDSDSDGKRHDSSLITDIQVSLIHKVTSVVYYYYYYYHYYYYWYNVWSRSTACEVHE
jgi:hypothetical protein